jgi:hypothetical protein
MPEIIEDVIPSIGHRPWQTLPAQLLTANNSEMVRKSREMVQFRRFDATSQAQ